MSNFYKWIRMFRHELKLLAGSIILAPLPLIYGGWLAYILFTLSPDVSQDLYMHTYDYHKIQHTFSLGVAMFGGMLLIRRDVNRPGYDWTGSLPVGSGITVTAKFAAGLVYLSLFTLSMAAVYIFAGMRHGTDIEAVLQHALDFSVQYTVSYAVTLGLGMLLASAIPNRISYLIGFCAWMFGTFFIDLFLIQRSGMFILKTFHLSRFFQESPEANEVFGPSVGRVEAEYSRRFILGFTVLELAVVCVLLQLARPSRQLKRGIVLASAALLTALLLFLPYWRFWQDRYASYEARLAAAPTEMELRRSTPLRPDSIQFPVKSYDIVLENTGGGVLTFQAVLRFDKPVLSGGRPLTFTLNGDFRLEGLALNGKETEWSREGSWIHIDPRFMDPSASLQTVEFRYTGKPEGWVPAPNDIETFGMVSEDDALYLPSRQAWYPLPGRQVLFVKRNGTLLELLDMRNTGFTGTADMSVTVRGVHRPVYGTLRKESMPTGADEQRFHQTDAAEATLFAGNTIEMRAEGTDTVLVTSPSNKREAQRFLTAYSGIMRDFGSWLEPPAPGLHAIYYFSMQEIGSWMYYYNDFSSNGHYFIGQQTHHNLDSYQLAQTVHTALFRDSYANHGFADIVGPGRSLVGEIRRAFYRVYLNRHPVPKEQRDWTGGKLYPRFITVMNGSNLVDSTVEKILAEGRMAELQKVLNAFYGKGLTVTFPAQLSYPIYTEKDWLMVWQEQTGTLP